ncbi:hypothetical protein Raf01_70890 [Rugosimonospora africana]|uniref:Transposase n=1 Tax=Rugosimonospora africana TaxID=556532 RepID=A0A8J3QZI2_9ACTN|nr:hypothetical protein Raf01_70890 [Rugosimonospora africana]
MIHTPVHASWLNQCEIYFSVVQRKVVTPNDFDDLADVENRLTAFQDLYNLAARPFNWRYTKKDLDIPSPTSPPTSQAFRQLPRDPRRINDQDHLATQLVTQRRRNGISIDGICPLTRVGTAAFEPTIP